MAKLKNLNYFKKNSAKIDNEEILRIMESVAGNAWLGNHEHTTVYIVAEDNIIKIEGYVYEDGYEYFTSSASITFNGEVLYGKNAKCTAPYKYERYNMGSFDDKNEALEFINKKTKGLTLEVIPQEDERILAIKEKEKVLQQKAIAEQQNKSVPPMENAKNTNIPKRNGRTLVVNLFAGPGAGKTTCAWAIASELKKRNIETEYVAEYAKEFVWDGNLEMLDGSYEHQRMLYEEQNRRVSRLIGKVDVVVTDSPAMLSLIYAKEMPDEFHDTILRDFKQQQNFNLFINRGKVFQQAGRKHSLSESIEIDNQIKEILKENDIYFGTYYHQTLNVLVDNIEKHLNNIKKKELQPSDLKNMIKTNIGNMPVEDYCKINEGFHVDTDDEIDL